MMTIKITFPTILALLLIFGSCSSQDSTCEKHESKITEKKEPHRYGGWYCPDNFGFTPVDIQNLSAVPAIEDRLPTEQELEDHKSLIKVDVEKHPDARALEMDLPRVATIRSGRIGMDELIIVIQAIVVSGDTIVGYRFPNGGNGSAWLSDVSFLSSEEVASYGSQPFFYATSVVDASKEDIWKALGQSSYFKTLGKRFDKQDFFSAAWTPESQAHLEYMTEKEYARGYVGTVYGNAYLHIDYKKDGFHYSEKLLMIEDKETQTTELYFASGPYPANYDRQEKEWTKWFDKVKSTSESF